MTIVQFSIFIGGLAFIIGFLLLVAPGFLKKANEVSARMISRIDNVTFSYRIGFGVSLILVSLFMFFMAYYFMKRH